MKETSTEMFRVRARYFVFYNEVCKRKMSARLSTGFSSLRCAQTRYTHIYSMVLENTRILARDVNITMTTTIILRSKYALVNIIVKSFNKNTQG